MRSNSLSTFIDSLPWRFFRKLALMQILITSFVIIVTAYMSRYYLKTYMTNQLHGQVQDSLEMIKQNLVTKNTSPVEWCKGLQVNTMTRFTVTDDKGNALCDNYMNIESIPNLYQTEEIQKALTNDFGFGKRFSKSHANEMLFGASKLSILDEKREITNYFIVQAISLDRLQKAMSALDHSIIIFLFPLLIGASLVTLWVSLQASFPLRKVLSKINKIGKVSNYKKNSSADDETFIDENNEWMVVERALDRASGDIENYVTELHNENVKIGTLMESISESIIAVKENGKILFANRHFFKNFLPKGFKKKRLYDFRIWEITRDLDIQVMIEQAFKENRIVKQRNSKQMTRPRGGEVFFDITVSPLTDQDKKTYGVVCVFHDVSDKVLASQMKEDFVANVSHEVRTPLTALKGYIQTLRMTSFENKEAIDNYLDKIESNSDRLISLFSDILNLSKIESSQKLKKSVVDVEEITSYVMTNIKQSYYMKPMNFEIINDIKEVYADPVMLEQVLTNLIENAWKYTPENGNIKVQWSIEDGKNVLKVCDSGETIPAEHQMRLFERFYRVDAHRSKEMGGTGLGLSIVKHIANKHGGTASFRPLSKEGGNCFIITLPISTPKNKSKNITYMKQ
ncbi:MAG: PAS domain-containing protein [Deltaproteobacteria bacterium]|nr:MAG: PAS domain-containing protein [Deltaproteobacteria bacterium]